ncbi:PREDICTED: conserved oligomeric Golgi complex subunit 7-like isoform X2 [Priapulus caudatus]|uniref:Conserved oligomeric Golgi complex subunit 7 n=1 Tax=Priapulus caudatus TaxID=37621 RepID=A0ABM1DPM1_PRICU|nr:PREDICTED: conserved oligomeric Golgi complex subunit 7-like isoform X2 [Priapulus caudatus]
MDFSRFVDENFDVKEWVNAAFATPDAQGSIDAHAASLVMKLQMLVQELNNSLEETSIQAVQNLPRVLRDIDSVRQEAAMLQEQMRLVAEDIQKVERDTSQSMHVLLKIDQIKCRMQEASHALKEADNWTTLSADVEDVFRSGDIENIASKLVAMQQSLQLLVDVPDYKERCQYLNTLKTRLEAILSPQLVSAFSSHSLDGALMYVKIFKDIDTLPSLQKYYHKCIKNQLHDQWRKIKDTDPDETILDWLNAFYDVLVSAWHTQLKWCTQVFDEPVMVVCEIMDATLAGMEPPISQCIENEVCNRPNPLICLLELKEVTDRYAKSMEGLITAVGKDVCCLPCVTMLARRIYEPYRGDMSQYGIQEEGLLMIQLANIRLQREEIVDCVRMLGESVPKLFAYAHEASERCLTYTSGCGFPALVQALKAFFASYHHEFNRILKMVKGQDKSNEDDNWSLYQQALRIIQVCGELLLHVEDFDKTLREQLLSVATKFTPVADDIPLELEHGTDTRGNPFMLMDQLLLDRQADRMALYELINHCKKHKDEICLLYDTQTNVRTLCEDVHRFAFNVVFSQIENHLQDMHSMKAWQLDKAGGALMVDLPSFGLSPQEYITKIGQYLMTLPQHIEPFIIGDNAALLAALQHARLPYTDGKGHIADVWLEVFANATQQHYVEAILRITELTPHAIKQLVTDVDYLTNVFDDLGLHPTEELKSVRHLLTVNADAFLQGGDEPHAQRLVVAISRMRGIMLR